MSAAYTHGQIVDAELANQSSRFALVLLRPRHTMRQIAVTRRRDKLLQQIVSCDMWNHCSCDRILSLRSVARIQAGLNSCRDMSQRQNERKQPCRNLCTHLRQVAATKSSNEHQFVSRYVKLKLDYISSLSKLIACNEQVSYRSYLSQQQCRREELSRDMSQRFVASCVSAFIINN